MIWDREEYVLMEQEPHKILIDLHGARFRGPYGLIFKKEGRGREQWLLFEKKSG